MAEDFDDFGDFASAFPTTSGVNDANTAQTTSSSVTKQANSADKVDFLASFPPPISSTSGDTVPLDFTSFDAFSNHTSEGIVAGGEISDFGRFDVANMDLSELKIPSPTDPNIHMAGGVAFDIPPILDDDFSDPTSPTALPNQVQFQGDLFSADFASQEVKENHSDINLSFPTSFSGTQQSAAQEDKKDDSFGDFESSDSLKPSTSGLKTAAEPSNVEGGNLGLFPTNSTPAATGIDSNAREVTNSGQILGLGGDLKLSDDFGEFGDFRQSTGVDKTETSAITNLGNSSDAVGFVNFESTANESKQCDTNTADDPLPHPSGNGFLAGFNHFQSSEPIEGANQDSTQQFGDFGAFSSSSGTATTQQEGGFGGFQTQSGSSATAAQDDTTQAAATDVQGDAQFGDFGAFSSSAGTTGAKDDAEFGNFGGFQAPAADSTAIAQSDAQFGDFGAFSSSSTTTTKENDFGNFGSFQTESNSTAVPSSTASIQQGDDFGTFADSTSKEDDFGDFSTSDFGNFASSEPTPNATSNNAILKGIENVIGNCFPGAGSSQDKQDPLKATQLTSRLVSPSQSPESSENDPTPKVWTALQKSVDFTVPLKKWDSSYMQDNYYMALKMDPKLVPKAGILPLFNSMGQFGAPLGGVTALDLLESFGFEGGLEAVTHEPSSPTSPTSEFPFRSGSPGPALLDLSLPTSPRSPTNKDASFTLDADLLGLDLNPQSQGKPLTSIQELVLNERLVVSRSTWMDSELLELGGSSGGGASGNHTPSGDSANSAAAVAGGDTSSAQQTSSSSRSSTPRMGKKQNSIELQLLQLGLDASKTTLSSVASHTELSLTARSTLGRLPDLSFMLQGDKIVRSTYQSGPSAS